MTTFTVEQANKMLPLVRRIVADIVRQYQRWEARMRELEVVTASERMERPDPQAESLRREMQELAIEIDGYRRELQELGVLCKDEALGLVDFPGELGGRPVYLCWRLGEGSVEHWHDLDAGYAGRQPLGPRLFAQRGRTS